MKILGIRIMWEKNYKNVLRFREEVEEILRRKLPLVSDKTLKNKNITLSRGLVLVNSSIMESRIKYRSVDLIKVLYHGILAHNMFTKEK